MLKIRQRQIATLDEQFEGLRKARDHYVLLANQIRDAIANSSGTAEEGLAEETNARRIAGAYEKSLQNMIAQIRPG